MYREMIVVESKKELIELINQRIKEQGPNCDLNDIDVSGITDMSYVFSTSPFNGDISEWDVSNVKNMYGMFSRSQFNGDISQWNVGKVRNMKYMFVGSPLDGNEPEWWRTRLN